MEVSLGQGCALVLTHPDANACPDAVRVGAARACWVGSSCPSVRVRARALSSAGPLALPWRQATASTSDLRGRLLEVRDEVQQHLARRDLDSALRALHGVIGSRAIRPIEWISLAPLLAASGARAEAWSIASSDRLAPL
ncbi:MAG: hypothetical protein QF464_02485, partial [Myxococcota bacterium]|nr:hypothetical protein [Myxococcota bacterium]